ncbi:MAG: hypothetical protein JNM93_05285 [Bacteriovoracaceae bacterium]|nr:hypothetical protein [Bacteriovoracaceae bacterium]
MKFFVLILLMLPLHLYAQHGGHGHGHHHHTDELAEQYAELILLIKTQKPSYPLIAPTDLKLNPIKLGNEVLYELPSTQYLKQSLGILKEMVVHECGHTHGCHVGAAKESMNKFTYWMLAPARTVIWSLKLAHSLVMGLWHGVEMFARETWISLFQYEWYYALVGGATSGAIEVAEHATPLGKFFNKFPICNYLQAAVWTQLKRLKTSVEIFTRKLPNGDEVNNKFLARWETFFSNWYYRSLYFSHLRKAHQLAYEENLPENKVELIEKIKHKIYDDEEHTNRFIKQVESVVTKVQRTIKSFDVEYYGYKKFSLWDASESAMLEFPQDLFDQEIDFLINVSNKAERALLVQQHVDGLQLFSKLLKDILIGYNEEGILKGVHYHLWLKRYGKMAKMLDDYTINLKLLSLPEAQTLLATDSSLVKNQLHQVFEQMTKFAPQLDEAHLARQSQWIHYKVNQWPVYGNCQRFFEKNIHPSIESSKVILDKIWHSTLHAVGYKH